MEGTTVQTWCCWLSRSFPGLSQTQSLWTEWVHLSWTQCGYLSSVAQEATFISPQLHGPNNYRVDYDKDTVLIYIQKVRGSHSEEQQMMVWTLILTRWCFSVWKRWIHQSHISAPTRVHGEETEASCGQDLRLLRAKWDKLCFQLRNTLWCATCIHLHIFYINTYNKGP